MNMDEPGFEEVVVPDGRRGLWVRRWIRTAEGGEVPDPDRWYELGGRAGPTRIDLAAGREGDDAEVSFRVGDVVDVRQVVLLSELVNTLRYAHEVAAEDASSAEAQLGVLAAAADVAPQGAAVPTREDVDHAVLVLRNALRMLSRVRRAVSSL
jgi:hypothetical protein